MASGRRIAATIGRRAAPRPDAALAGRMLPPSARRGLLWVTFVVAALWHASDVRAAWTTAQRVTGANDYASYHYAAVVAAEGGDPYDGRALGMAARKEGTRQGVHPFFYPPPFLLAFAPRAALPLHDGYLGWFVFDEVAALGLGAVLAAMARRWSTSAAIVALVLTLAMSAVPNNHVMGQINLPVLLAAVVGFALAERGRARVGGALVGAAAMAKMAPALFVGLWLLQRRWQPFLWACAAAACLGVASFAVVHADAQLRFYTEVLPGFSRGDYNGLAVGIDLPGNHSLPDWLDRAWPPGPSPHLVLSSAATMASRVAAIALLGVTAWFVGAWRGERVDALAQANRFGAVAALTLLLPVITYEHHLVSLLPGLVAAAAARAEGRLPAWSVVVWLFAAAVACAPWEPLRDAAKAWGGVGGTLLREAKFGAIVAVWGLNLVAGRAR
jgi:hypothetical protein